MGLDLDLYKIPKTKKNETQDILKKYNDLHKENLSFTGPRTSLIYKYSEQLSDLCKEYKYFGSDGWFLIHLLKEYGINPQEIEYAVLMPQTLVNHLIELKQKFQNMVEKNPDLVDFGVFNEFPIDVDNDHIYVVEANW